MTTRFMSRASAAFLLFVAAAASGQAQASYDSTGALRFGAFVQGSEFDLEVERPAIARGFNFSSDTVFGGGASIGYDWGSRKGLILGLEADVSVDEDADYLATFRGRLGTHLHPGWLVYATAGGAYLDVEDSDPMFGKVSDTLTGWTVGGGTELDLDRITLFAEYLFADFDSLDFRVLNLPGTPPGTVTPVSLDVDEQLFRVGVKFKIGGDEGARQGLK
jgi:opacity protein-like surface antigen